MDPKMMRTPRALAPSIGLLFVLFFPMISRAQIPDIPGITSPKKVKEASDSPQAAPTAESPKAKVASPSGKIAVREAVTDQALRSTLEGLLKRYPGVRHVDVSVENGFVTIEGQADNDETHDRITDFARRVEGTRLVLNLMVTDDEVMTAPQLAMRKLDAVRLYMDANWLVIVIAVGAVLGSILVARLFGRYSETLLGPFVSNSLLRSVLGSLIGGGIVIGGAMMALATLELTQVVLSILGLAGVVGLAVGFAFKDITENFIASVLLGVRRPFRAGDSIRVAGQSGVVQSLNTRATVLVTAEGNHVRIPNSIVYKEILVNSSASEATRVEFDVLIPFEASTSESIAAMTSALKSQDGVRPDPAPRALVKALEPGGVRLRATYWAPTKGVDGDKLLSEAMLKIKVALQQKGALETLVPWGMQRTSASSPKPAQAPASPAKPVHANVKKDAEAASKAAPVADGRESALAPGVMQAASPMGNEGVNLLNNGKEHAVNGKT